MNKFLDFMRVHWRVFAELAILIIVTLITIFRKKVKVIDFIYTVILEILPQAIKESEQKFGSGHGDEKKSYVLNRVINGLCEQFGISKTEAIKTYRSFIESSLEQILTTPQKKER